MPLIFMDHLRLTQHNLHLAQAPKSKRLAKRHITYMLTSERVIQTGLRGVWHSVHYVLNSDEQSVGSGVE
jgi:hypothetical protein